MNVLELSKYVIASYSENNCEISNLKLQKILYYVQGYFLRKNALAFDEEIYNWPYGPVIQETYYGYKSFGVTPISADKNPSSCYLRDLSKKSKRLIDNIIKRTFPLESFELVKMTREEEPWETTKNGEIINKNKIYNYFKANDSLGLYTDNLKAIN